MIEFINTWLEPSLLAVLYSLLALLSGSVLMSLALPTWAWLKTAKVSIYGLILLLPCYLVNITLALTDSDWPNFAASAYLVIKQSNLGQMWLLMCVAVALAWFALLFSLKPQAQKIALLVAFWLCCLARAASGHAADTGLLSGDVWIHSLHIAAACTWFGIIVCYLGAMRYAQQQAHVHTATTHLSEIATLCLLAIILTGFADSLRIYQMASNFWQSLYVQVLATKLVLMLSAIALAGFNRLWVMPRLTQHTRTFYGVAALESLILVIILFLASFLGSLMPDA